MVEYIILLVLDYVGKGVGCVFMSVLCDCVKDNGKYLIFVVVSVENDVGVLFYEKVGFE